MKKKTLTFATWNIQGLNSKLDEEDFKQEISKFDCIVLTETWLTEPLDIAGWYTYCKIRSTGKYERNRHGGITLLLKPEVRKGVTIIEIGRAHV